MERHNEKPELNEIERLKMENLALKYNALEQQQQALMMQRVQVIKEIEARLPGWTWRDPDGLVPEPPIPEPYPEFTPR